jgi:hypothetical protein
MNIGYKVIITGINEEMDKGQVVSALAGLFKKSPELMEKNCRDRPGS